MNILHITASLRDADFIEHELTSIAPDFKLTVSPTLQDAAARLETPGAYDAILLDMLLPGGDPTGIITHVRQKDIPVAVIALTGTGEKEPPMEALKAGANDYMVKRPGFASQLPAILRRTVERYKIQKSPLRILFVGNMDRMRRELSLEKRLQFEPATIGQDGSCRGANGSPSNLSQYDAVLLEEGFLGVHILIVLRDILSRARDLPVLLMIDPGHEEIGVQGLSFGAADCTIKSGNYFLSLPALIRNAVARRELILQRNVLASAEARLRMLIERVPSCVVMLTSEGDFLAINWAGLSLVGARRPEELVGKNFPALLPEDRRSSLKAFIEGVCRGEPDSIQFDWEGLDGKPRHLELRGVPVRRDSDSTMNLLGVIDDLTQIASLQGTVEESNARLELLQQAVQESAGPEKQLMQQLHMEREEWAAERREIQQQLEITAKERDRLQEALDSAQSQESDLSRLLAQEQAQREAARGEFEHRLKAAQEERTQLQEKLEASEARGSELAGTFAREQERWETARRELERQAKAAGEERDRFREAVSAAESRHSGLAEMLASEQAARQGFEHRATSAEEQLQASEARRIELTEMLTREQARWDVSCREFEQEVKAAGEERTQLQEKLQASEAQRTELAETLAREQARWEATCQESVQEARTKDEERAQLQEKLRASEAQRAELAETLASEQVRWDATCRECEQEVKAAAEERVQLQEKLRVSETLRTELAESIKLGQTQWDSARSDLEQKLKASEAREHEPVEALAAERAKWEETRRDLEQRTRALEEERTRLQGQLQESEARQPELVEALAAERAQWEVARRNLEERTTALQEERIQLLERLQAAEARQPEFINAFSLERAEWEVVRRGLEQQTKALEEERLQLQGKLQAVESRQPELAEALSLERAEWEVARRSLERRTQSLEEERHRLQVKLEAAEARQLELDEALTIGRAEWEALRQSLEQRTKVLEEERDQVKEKLQAAEVLKPTPTETLTLERTEWEMALQNLEQRTNALEEERVQLQEKLQAAEARRPQSEGLLAQARTELESARQELEHRASVAEKQLDQFKANLKAAEDRLSELNQVFIREQANWETERLRLERRAKAAEAESAQLLEELDAKKSRLAESGEILARERGAWDSARQEFEARVQAAEERLSQLGQRLEASGANLLESRLADLQGEYESQRARWEDLRGGLEQKCRDAEAQQAALETALRVEQAQTLESVDSHRADQARWEEMRKELEGRVHALEGDLHRFRMERAKPANQPSEQRQIGPPGISRGPGPQLHTLAAQPAQDDGLSGAALQPVEERGRRIADFCRLGQSISRPDGHILYCNDTFAHILGYSSAEDVLAQPDDGPLRAIAAQQFPAQSPLVPGEAAGRVERCVWRKDGRPAWLMESTALVHDAGQQGPVVERWIIDVTEQHQLFEEMRRLRRAETVARLAAATVQEFHNLHRSMTQYGNLFLQGLDEHDPRREKAERIQQIADRVGSMAEKLAAIVRRQDPEPETIDLGSALSAAQPMLQMLAGDDIDLVVRQEPGLGSVALGRAKLEQVLTALLVSARECLPAGGTVTIEAKGAGADPTAMPYPSVVLSVRSAGYAVLAPQRTGNIDRLVLSCQGRLQTGGESGKEALYTLSLPGV